MILVKKPRKYFHFLNESGEILEFIKKLLTIIILSLFWSSNIFAETIVKLPKDTASGFKILTKSLSKNYKKYGMQVVDKKDGHPVRAGQKSIRFEVRDGDCGKDDYGGWSDCKGDRERHELSANQKGDTMSKGEYWCMILSPK